MSEICHNCPIKSNDEDYAVLCAVAEVFVDVNDPIDDGWIRLHSSDIPAHELYDDELLRGLANKGDELSSEKIDKARKCAQLILWNQCEFRNLE